MANEATAAAREAIATVTVTREEYDRMLAAAKVVRFLNDPRAKVELQRPDADTPDQRWSCVYADPFTAQPGAEYGETPQLACEAAMRVIQWRRRIRATAASTAAA